MEKNYPFTTMHAINMSIQTYTRAYLGMHECTYTLPRSSEPSNMHEYTHTYTHAHNTQSPESTSRKWHFQTHTTTHTRLDVHTKAHNIRPISKKDRSRQLPTHEHVHTYAHTPHTCTHTHILTGSDCLTIPESL
jgi:hypothetical protein